MALIQPARRIPSRGIQKTIRYEMFMICVGPYECLMNIILRDGPFDFQGEGWYFSSRQVIFSSLLAQQVIFFKGKLQQVFYFFEKITH